MSIADLSNFAIEARKHGFGRNEQLQLPVWKNGMFAFWRRLVVLKLKGCCVNQPHFGGTLLLVDVQVTALST